MTAPHAEAAREAARRPDGQFGTQERPEAPIGPGGVNLDSTGRPAGCPCDYNPDTTEGPEIDCPVHGHLDYRAAEHHDYTVAGGGSRQSDGPLPELHLSTENRVAREAARLVEDGQMDLNPPYQRGSVWTLDQRVALVKSWCLGLPVPPVTINDRTSNEWASNNGGVNPIDSPGGHGIYGVVDGKQRLETARAWFGGRFGVPASWFRPEEVEETFETPDGPYVTYDRLTRNGQTAMGFHAKLPWTTAHVGSVEAEAELYLLLNGGGTQQTDADMANAARVAGRTATSER